MNYFVINLLLTFSILLYDKLFVKLYLQHAILFVLHVGYMLLTYVLCAFYMFQTWVSAYRSSAERHCLCSADRRAMLGILCIISKLEAIVFLLCVLELYYSI
jgi:hypothetical protein